MFLVLSLQDKVNIENPSATIPLSWAEGMLGVLPVFESYEKALTYAEGNFEIITEIQYTQESP